ncbi:response regulator [Megalodesulfovibrio gigas]|uniref:Putative response regulator receiver protein n=1 Tax=Megalodesulfovibrio gigas (strain ATCC 19364 / DSM 1382 / NCIMB 9332 / VKM B-1759) TaxID=1121448 RepID=T2G9B6_MEGG1|nr:response regulator [Megalodesulfovibrio gigas]AGW12711.1 putative response regulator receiver protein [Megalodesulfovibrio gigas DSM 1382 = ATCC 19364]
MKTLAECLVLIVDDTETNVDILVEALGEEYGVAVAMDGDTALEFTAAQHPDIVLLDIMMPGMDGYEVCRRLKADPATAAIPVIFLTAMGEVEHKIKGFELGAADYVTKPFEVREIKARVRTHLSLLLAQMELARQREALEAAVRERSRSLAQVQEVILDAMACLAEFRNPDAGGHLQRMRRYVLLLARHLQTHPRFAATLTDAYIEALHAGAALHDLGAAGIPDTILLKPGTLTVEEFEVMKRHAVMGREAIRCASRRLGSNAVLDLAQEIAASHQERWDGSGYPQGLKAETIPVCGRIVAVADVYDALVSRRPHRPPNTHADAVGIILNGRGVLFDPDVVDAFAALQEAFRHIALQGAEGAEDQDGREALAVPHERKE